MQAAVTALVTAVLHMLQNGPSVLALCPILQLLRILLLGIIFCGNIANRFCLHSRSIRPMFLMRSPPHSTPGPSPAPGQFFIPYPLNSAPKPQMSFYRLSFFIVRITACARIPTSCANPLDKPFFTLYDRHKVTGFECVRYAISTFMSI